MSASHIRRSHRDASALPGAVEELSTACREAGLPVVTCLWLGTREREPFVEASEVTAAPCRLVNVDEVGSH